MARNSSSDLPMPVAFAVSSAAPMMAAIFTNPFDVAKTRLQLQGELMRLDKSKRVYTSTGDVIWKTFRAEGLRGLQRGIAPALMREGTRNFFRLGLYEPLANALTASDSNGRIGKFGKRLVAGATSGIIGSVVCNPFEIVKTRMQSQAAGGVTVQHGYTGMWHGLSSIYKQRGVQGLWAGSSINAMRALVGTSLTLATYSSAKDATIDLINPNSVASDVACSMTAAVTTTAGMHPLDIVRTRLYNQSEKGAGRMYSRGAIGAIVAIARTEGPLAFYKGVTAHFLRIGPHCVLTFVFLEQLRRTARTWLATTTPTHAAPTTTPTPRAVTQAA